MSTRHKPGTWIVVRDVKARNYMVLRDLLGSGGQCEFLLRYEGLPAYEQVGHLGLREAEHAADFEKAGHGSGGLRLLRNLRQLAHQLCEPQRVVGRVGGLAVLPSGHTRLRDPGPTRDFGLRQAGRAQPLDQFGGLAHSCIVCVPAYAVKREIYATRH